MHYIIKATPHIPIKKGRSLNVLLIHNINQFLFGNYYFNNLLFIPVLSSAAAVITNSTELASTCMQYDGICPNAAKIAAEENPLVITVPS